MLSNKIDFAVVFTVKNANPNGDPLLGNRPRQTSDGLGEVSDVCLKRKIRNRLQQMGEKIFVQMDSMCDDGMNSLSKRFEAFLKSKKAEDISKAVCEEWFDVRAFGQVFAFKKREGVDEVSMGIRGPVTIQPALSLEPVIMESIQITKSVNSEPDESGKKSSDTMGMKHRVDYGLYRFNGSINPQLASKTGFSDEDAEAVKQALIHLFDNDASSARPEGSMEVVRVYWWKHNCRNGQYSSAKVHRTLSIVPKPGTIDPKDISDYEFSLSDLDGLKPEVIDGE